MIAFEYLKDKAQSHSKVRQSMYQDLSGAPYFYDSRFTPELMQLIFQFRTRMYGVKNNFRNNYDVNNLYCPVCRDNIDEQSHLFQCKPILMVTGKIEEDYEDLFDQDVNKIFKAAITARKLVQTRKKLH